MKKEQTKKSEYQIYGKVIIDSTYTVTANSLEEAVAKSKSLKEDDFVDILGDSIDRSLEITGVYKV